MKPTSPLNCLHNSYAIFKHPPVPPPSPSKLNHQHKPYIKLPSDHTMNWRKKNPPSSSSSGLSSSLSSWFSKFKPNRRKSNYPLAKTKQKSRPNSPIVPSSPLKDVIDQGILQSVFYSSQDELDFEFPFSTSRSCRSYTKEFTRDQEDDSHKFSDMVSDLRKMRILNEGDQDEERQEKMLETPRRKIQKGRKITRNKRDEVIFDVLYSDSGRESAELAEKKFLDLEETEEIKIVKSDIEVSNCHYISSSNSRAENEKDKLQINENGTVSKQNSLKEVKVSSSEKQRKSVYISRESQRRKVKQSCKVRAYSPRTASKLEICKIRALEDKKKAKNKKKDRIVEEGPALESYAMEKSSFDPEKDFRESMEEMIEEIGIWKAEGLENLLACYLSLNSTEYHDIIVKVFRQVWLDLNKHYSCSYSELQNDDYCYINDR